MKDRRGMPETRRSSGILARWWRKRRLAYGTITIVIITGFVLGELVARYYLGLGTPPLSVAHPTIEYMFKPNQDVRRFENRILINQYGMRTESFSREKKDDEFRIMVFGDSVINGGNLTDHDYLATSLIGRNLSSASYKNVVVGNVSAGGWGPGNWHAYVNEYGFFGADVVVLVISSHDYMDNPIFQTLNTNTHPTETPISALAEGVTRYLPRYLPKLNTFSDNAGVETEVNASKVVEIGLADLRSFLELAKAVSQRILVLQHWEKKELESRLAGPGNKRIREVCEQIGISPVSLEPYLRRSIEGGEDPYRDNIHLNKIGQQLLADAIITNLADITYSNSVER
jgi:lysophospholipase L1-like esterase